MSQPSTKAKSLATNPGGYARLLADIKQRVREAQHRATLSANAEMILMYWDVGCMIAARQQRQGWGAGVIPRLVLDLKNELSEHKGFSERNLKYMIRFAREYPPLPIVQRPVAQLQNAGSERSLMVPQAVGPLPVPAMPPIVQQTVAQLPWGHNIILFEKVKDLPTRLWYAQQAFAHGWSRDVLSLQIQSGAHRRQGKAVTNFSATLPPPQSDLAAQMLKDPYVFDFLTLEKPFHERELETGLLRHLQDFLVALGTGFAFVGRQVHLEVGDDDFYLDLLFYHLRLRCYVVIDLKVGRFKAEYAGKMNFYLNAVDDRMKHATDQPSIGLILCEEKNRIVAEYALRGMDKAIGVSAYELTRALPKKFQSALPSVAQLEQELALRKSPPPASSAKRGKRP